MKTSLIGHGYTLIPVSPGTGRCSLAIWRVPPRFVVHANGVEKPAGASPEANDAAGRNGERRRSTSPGAALWSVHLAVALVRNVSEAMTPQGTWPKCPVAPSDFQDDDFLPSELAQLQRLSAIFDELQHMQLSLSPSPKVSGKKKQGSDVRMQDMHGYLVRTDGAIEQLDHEQSAERLCRALVVDHLRRRQPRRRYRGGSCG